MNVLQSPRAKKGAKKRSKQSKIEISGKKKKKFILTLPDESSSSDGSNGKKAKREKDDSSVIVIDSDSSANGGVTTRSSSRKRKSEKSDEENDTKRVKSSQKGSKNGRAKNGKAAKNSEPKKAPQMQQPTPPVQKKISPGEQTLNDFLQKEDICKWRYVVDIISDEDCEALLILIEERKEAEANMLLKEQMKNKPFQKAKIKEEQQTDGSCDKQTDSTGSDSGEELKKKLKCRKNLEGEFFVYTYVNNEKKMLKLVEVTDSETDKTSEKDTENESDVPQKED